MLRIRARSLWWMRSSWWGSSITRTFCVYTKSTKAKTLSTSACSFWKEVSYMTKSRPSISLQHRKPIKWLRGSSWGRLRWRNFGSCTETSSQRTFSWEVPMITTAWLLILGCLRSAIKTSICSWDVELLATLRLRLSTSRTWLWRSTPSVTCLVLESFSISCSWVSRPSPGKHTTKCFLRIGPASSSLISLNMTPLTEKVVFE